MYLYCERALYDEIDGTCEAVLDFSDFSSLKNLETYFAMDGTENDTQSLLFLSKLKCEKYKGPRTGFWYNVPEKFFKELQVGNNGFDGNSRIRISLEPKK